MAYICDVMIVVFLSDCRFISKKTLENMEERKNESKGRLKE
jgi:hypothetical protein